MAGKSNLSADGNSGHSPSSGHAVASADNIFGSKTWWKRALVVVGVIYINGYLASRAFYASLGLSPSDFLLGEYDYLIQGLLYLTPDYYSIVHWQHNFIWYYLCIVLTWLLLWISAWLAFWKGARSNAWLYPIMLISLAVLISTAATLHGQQRAKVLKSLTEKLPNAIIYYLPDDKSQGIISGRLVSRNDKIVCLTSIDGWELAGTNIFNQQEGFFIIPMEKIQTIVIQ